MEYRLSKEGLVDDLRALGLKTGDAVLVHSNLRSLAPVKQILAAPEGGMRWLVDAFREVLGDEGILAVPTFTKTFKPGQPGPSGLVWDPGKTPSRVGTITNYVMKEPDASRSDHPTHSVAATGAKAAEFVSGHSWREGASTFDRKGPWGRLVDADGYIMWLGTAMPTQTACHVLEDWMRLPYMSTCVALVDDGGETREIEVTQSPAGHRDFYRKGSKVDVAWEEAALMKNGKVCKADASLMRAREFTGWLWDALRKAPGLLLCDSEECEFCREGTKATEKHLAGFEGDWRKPGG